MSHQPADDEKAVAEAQLRVWAAANRRDQAALEDLLSADFLLVEADSLERKNKAEFIADLATTDVGSELLQFELANVRVQLCGDMAVAFAQFHCEDEIEGERLRMSGNAVDIFVRSPSGWKLSGSVYGEIPPFSE